MNSPCLIDTQTFLRAAMAPGRLGKSIPPLLRDQGNSAFVSVVTFWEISLKFGLGKLDFEKTSPEEMPDIAGQMLFSIESLNEADAAAYFKLSRRGHKDPFDRMLVWQALRRNWTLISSDRAWPNIKQTG